MIREQFADTPTMIRYPSRHRRRPLQPLVPTDQSRQAQALMLPAKVIERSHQVHAHFQRPTLPRQPAPSPHQRSQALPKGRIQSFDEGRVDHAATLRAGQHLLDVGLRAFVNAAVNPDHTSLLILLDRLRDENFLPGLQTRTPRLSSRHGFTKNRANGTNIALQAIRAKQQTEGQGTGTSAHSLDQPRNQGEIAAMAHLAAQPQARRDHHGQGHPGDAALKFHAQFIHLHLAEIARAGNELLLNRLAMFSGAVAPIADGTLVEVESGDDGLRRAAVCQQGDDAGEEGLRVVETIKGRALGFSKGRLANRALIAAVFAGMNADVALVGFASGRTVHIRTKYGQRVQWRNPFRLFDQKGLSLDPRFMPKPLLHVLLRSYPVFNLTL